MSTAPLVNNPRGDVARDLAADVPRSLASTEQATPGVPLAPSRARRWRRRSLLIACVLAVALDLARPPAQQLSARGLVAAIHGYQATLSPRLGAVGVRCRFTPTCSHFAEGAIRRDGALVGSVRAAWRVLRCGPWTKAGTYDPP